MYARAVAGKNANKNNQNAAADKKRNYATDINSKDENCENEAASFSDILAEKYLWPQSDENDEERWEEYFYDDELFYSLYFYSRMVLDATGMDFAPFKSKLGGV